jgi:hypothetical protein
MSWCKRWIMNSLESLNETLELPLFFRRKKENPPGKNWND